MRFDTDLQAYLPDWYREILDYQELCLAEGERFQVLAREINGVADNFFFQSMDKGAVEQWEKVFEILPNPAGESLEFRRNRLLNRISSRPPFTMEFLRGKLDELIGPGKWTVNMDYPSYTLTIEASSQDQSYAEEVAFTIGGVKPAHIVYVNSPYLHTGIALGEEIVQGDVTYHYRLGQWALGAMPFATEEGLGLIKTAETPSIREEMLNATARRVLEDIAAARVNGTLTVTGLVKSVHGNAAVIRYLLPAGAAPAATKLELLDSAGEVLTESAVYIPVTGNVQIKHNIPITEVR